MDRVTIVAVHASEKRPNKPVSPEARLRPDQRPLYVRAQEALRNLLENGTYPPGVQLPNEPELAHQLGISRSTLREAVRSFEEEGWITRRQGVGTFVNQAPPLVIDSGLETLESIDSLVKRHGKSIQTQDLKIDSRPADERIAKVLGLAPGHPLTVVTRTKVAANHPVAFMVDALPADLISTQAIQDGFYGSVLDFLLESQIIEASHARADIVALSADETIAERLKVSPGTVLLLLEEIVFDTAGRAIDFSSNYFVPEFFKFHLLRRVNRRG